MTFKKLIPLLSGVTLISSGATLFAGNVNNAIQQDLDINKEKDTTILKGEQKLEENTNSKTEDGENGYKNKWWFCHKIWLNHETLASVDSYIKGDTDTVTDVINSIPVVGTFIKYGIKAQKYQWNWWNPTSYDKGKGIIITAYGGGAPLVISGIEAQ